MTTICQLMSRRRLQGFRLTSWWRWRLRAAIRLPSLLRLVSLALFRWQARILTTMTARLRLLLRLRPQKRFLGLLRLRLLGAFHSRAYLLRMPTW